MKKPEDTVNRNLKRITKKEMNISFHSLASQIKSVVLLCSSYLESGLDLENCVDILSLADTFSLQKLRPQVYFLSDE